MEIKSIKPLISIITIVYNDLEGIGRTIESVLNQSFKDYQYIVIDALSNDGTSRIIESYSSKIDFYIKEKDKGIFDGFNKGVKVSKGDWIYFLNSGDYLINKDILYNVSTSYLKGSPFDILTGKVKIVDNSLCSLGYTHPTRMFKIDELKNQNIIAHQATFVKREIFNMIGDFNDFKIHMDYELWIRAWQARLKFQFIDVPIACFVKDGISSARNNYPLALNEQMNILLDYKVLSYKEYYSRLYPKLLFFYIKTLFIKIIGQKAYLYIQLKRSY